MVLLLDIGNTHTHFAVSKKGMPRHGDVTPTALWQQGKVPPAILRRAGHLRAVALCSVVPEATRQARVAIRKQWGAPVFELTASTVRGIGIDYPKPETIGPDRLANAVAAKKLFGAPVVVVDFGTAVTFDVVDAKGNYTGGIIAPGLAAMTSYLHEKTALLPEIKIRDIQAIVGKSTKEAMLIGAVHGYRGLVRELISELKRELNCPALPVIATGGYAALMSRKLPEISLTDPLLTLRGLRIDYDLQVKV
jgi:type III pantothenate kinase